MLLSAFAQAFAQTTDPRIRRVLALSVGVSVLVYAGLIGVLWWGLTGTQALALPWADLLVDVLGGLAAFFLALLLFPAVVSTVAGLFLDDVADAVEARHYPALAAPRRQTLAQGVGAGLRLGLLAVALNILVLPLYFVPVVNLMVFYALNGYLLGREYFELAASRHADPAAVLALRRRYRGRLWLAGAGIAALATVPVLNMIFPVLGAAVMVHVARGLRAED